MECINKDKRIKRLTYLTLTTFRSCRVRCWIIAFFFGHQHRAVPPTPPCQTLQQKCHGDVISAKNTFMPKCINDNLNNQNECLAVLWTIVKHKTAERNRCAFEPSARSSQAGCISLRDDSFKG